MFQLPFSKQRDKLTNGTRDQTYRFIGEPIINHLTVWNNCWEKFVQKLFIFFFFCQTWSKDCLLCNNIFHKLFQCGKEKYLLFISFLVCFFFLSPERFFFSYLSFDITYMLWITMWRFLWFFIIFYLICETTILFDSKMSQEFQWIYYLDSWSFLFLIGKKKI